MWIKLDFTPLFRAGLLVGLLLVALGVFIRSNYHKVAALGLFIVIAGAIPAVVFGFLLASDAIGKWRDNQRNRTRVERLPEDREIQGLRLPRGTKVEWYGRLPVISGATLAQPLQVLGLPFEGELKFVNTFGNDDFHVSTALEKGTLAVDHLIAGVPCKAHKEVEFFPASGPEGDGGRAPKAGIGKLRRCTSSAELEFRGNRYLADTELTFNPFDGVERGILAVDQDVDGHWCKGGAEIERREDRAIRFTLGRDETVGGVDCKAGTEVRLEQEKGRVVSAVLSHDQQIGGFPCRGGEAVGFDYGDGSYPLDSCVISHPVTVVDVVWPAGSGLRGLSMDWLEATLPVDSGQLTIGEVKIVGRCKVHLKKTPPTLESVAPLDEAGYAELRGARFAEFNVVDGSGWGRLAEAANFDGIAYQAGALVRFVIGPQK
jgi:hypothetical protein